MSTRILSPCLLADVFTCLGPDCYHLRATCLQTRVISDTQDLAMDILKWMCVNTTLLLDCLEVLGNIPIRCSLCSARTPSRQRYRLSLRRDPGRAGVVYLCSLCVFQETRRFLTGGQSCFPAAGLHNRQRAHIMMQILCRMRMTRAGLLKACLEQWLRWPRE